MVIMETHHYAEDYHQQELFNKIEKLHFNYLVIEESPEKLDIRLKLEDCIREFLNVAPSNAKFYNPETAQVLYKSACGKSDFSGYKAATGFNAIQLYAGNVLSQPWRREYHQIRMYSGFYKHQIEANLVDAELLFKAMGYRQSGDSGILVLDGPVCPDKAVILSRDCLVAYVECQIMKTIWEELSPRINMTWIDVLELRRKFYCGAEQTIKIVKHQLSQKKCQELEQNDFTNGDCNFTQQWQQRPLVTPPMYNIHPQSVRPSYAVSSMNDLGVPYGPMAGHKYPCDSPNCCCVNSALPSALPYQITPNPAYSIPVSIPQPAVNCNGYCHANVYSHPRHQFALNNYSYRSVPTAELLKLGTQSNSYDSVDGVVAGGRLSRQNSLQVNETTFNRKTSEDSQNEDWDYVYRDLESHGYTKDLGERGNILAQGSNTQHRQRKSNDVSLDKPVAEATYSNSNKQLADRAQKTNGKQNVYEEVKKTGLTLTTKVNAVEQNKGIRKKSAGNDAVKPVENNKSSKDPRLPEKVTRPVPSEDSWQCKHCTYLNEGKKDVCEICSKSRVVVVDHQIEIGGTECSQCTLVNPKHRKTCNACDNNLKNSPTYI